MTSSSESLRFGFGKNWRNFISRGFSMERLNAAKKHLLDFVGRESLAGLDFLDMGCGSGIHSMAALRSGARRIHSFDYDPDSVAATRELWQKAGYPEHWTIEQGDVLDADYISKLGKWNFVYSWGVLHHTGAVWQALRNAQTAVTDGGMFYIALYSSDVDSQPSREFWIEIKKEYNRVSPLTRHIMVWWYVWRFILDQKFTNFPKFIGRLASYKFQRGMSLLTDIRDWIGGWPMEFVPDQAVVDLLEGECGFELINVATGHACSEFLLRRTGVISKKTVVVDMVRGWRARSSTSEPADLVSAPASS
jgi:2-polyprenyl-6-hydroxyphenyl methylase/3-demethylubiquinone-9 3-methyltransferase